MSDTISDTPLEPPEPDDHEAHSVELTHEIPIVVNVAAPAVTVEAGDTHVKLPEGWARIEFTVQQHDRTRDIILGIIAAILLAGLFV